MIIACDLLLSRQQLPNYRLQGGGGSPLEFRKTSKHSSTSGGVFGACFIPLHVLSVQLSFKQLQNTHGIISHRTCPFPPARSSRICSARVREAVTAKFAAVHARANTADEASILTIQGRNELSGRRGGGDYVMCARKTSRPQRLRWGREGEEEWKLVGRGGRGQEQGRRGGGAHM